MAVVKVMIIAEVEFRDWGPVQPEGE